MSTAIEFRSHKRNFNNPARSLVRGFMRAAAPRYLLGIAALASFVSGCGKSDKVAADASAPTAAVVNVARHDLANTLEIASEFEPYQEIEVYAKVSGYIQKLYVDWGTHVKEGQPMADLEIPELQQQLQEDQATIHRNENDLDRAREELNRSNSAYKVAHLTYSRLADVQKSQPGLVAQQDIDVAEGKDVEANASVSAAKDALAAAEQALAAAKATFEKDKALYAYSHISAPFDGVVTRLYAYKGALLPGGTSSNIGTQALCRLSQNNLLRLVIPVPERAVPDIHLGELIDVKISTTGKTFRGKVIRVSDQIDLQTRTMHTEVEVPNPNYELVPGMYAAAEIPLQTAQKALTLPPQAIQPSGNNKGAVLLVNGDNRIEKREVTLGIQTANQVEIVSGLKENDRVIFGSQTQYQPGESVSPKAVQAQEMEQ
ncbi:MAG TPA: efflux RND transporter periplasmic adaptor subunit [Terriglobales bacterium]|nr:efflux RND transporter periplasmic adaptor subunit [Terriglobales bacterium]HZP32765.1 efflux RND transporter periplasmic adaptor subunit [Candidatus Acidoferrales bacterium]